MRGDGLGNGAGVEWKAAKINDGVQLGRLRWVQINLHEVQKLTVAILLDHINGLVATHKLFNFLREGVRTDAQVVGSDL